MKGFWTATKEKLLEALWDKKLSAREIAAQLGCTRNSVLGKAHRLGLDYRAPASVEIKGVRVKIKQPPKTEKKPPQRPDLQVEIPDDVPRGTVAEIYETLARDACRWIYGDPAGTDFGFCTNTQEEGKSYCTAHMAKVFIRDTRDERKASKQ